MLTLLTFSDTKLIFKSLLYFGYALSKPLIEILSSKLALSSVSHLWCEHFIDYCTAPATQRKMEGGERDIHLINVNEASSCLAQGYCVPYSPHKESGAYQAPPPTHTLPMQDFSHFW
jgi:hypothetical protein